MKSSNNINHNNIRKTSHLRWTPSTLGTSTKTLPLPVFPYPYIYLLYLSVHKSKPRSGGLSITGGYPAVCRVRRPDLAHLGTLPRQNITSEAQRGRGERVQNRGMRCWECLFNTHVHTYIHTLKDYDYFLLQCCLLRSLKVSGPSISSCAILEKF